MLFNSLHFLIFFPVVASIYFALPQRFRWALLLVASCYFYMAFIPAYILILIFLIIIDYTAGIIIENSTGARRRILLVISLVANLSLLFVFKYLEFITGNIEAFTAGLGLPVSLHHWNIILPIGLSFHTFQSMSYTIEVYRGKQKAEHHFGIYALYVLFFPQMVAGPIERPGNLLHQFYERHSFEYRRVTDGLKLMLWGFIKKIVIADRLAMLVNTVYNHPTDYTGVPLLIASYFFAFQIYCDFSGYSDIAIGAAQVMGFTLMQNFNRPYFSKSISEFWRRWHISLSSWFRDYLYIPLGGNRVVRWRWYFNLFFVFLVSGLWHGANWTYLAWGGIHGAYLVLSLWTEGIRGRIETLLRWIPERLRSVAKVVFMFHLVLLAWIFFRANSITDAWYVLTHVLSGITLTSYNAYAFGMSPFDFVLSLVSIAALLGVHLSQERLRLRLWIAAKPLWFRWAAYYAAIAVILLFGKFDAQSFIYFQF